jgi:prophage maintenance system killer protein
MEEITVRKVLEIHDRIVAETGGDKRILSEASLYQFILQVNLIHECIPQAAHILFSLCTYPVFREKNTETAFILAESVLASGGYRICGTTAEMTALAEAILGYSVEIEDIEGWLCRNIKKARSP